MKRRDFLVTVTGALLCGTAAHAKDYPDDILRQLKRNGYAINSVSTTLLGRTRIRASKGGGEREIVLNAATGEILRDVWVKERSDGKGSSLHDDNGEDGGGNSGHGGGDDDADEDDEDDEDEDDTDEDEDNSGSGSGDSGDDN